MEGLFFEEHGWIGNDEKIVPFVVNKSVIFTAILK